MTVEHEIDYHRIFKISPTPMALLTPDLVILDANDEFLDALGRTLDELAGKYVFKVFPKMPRGPGGPKITALEAALASHEREGSPADQVRLRRLRQARSVRRALLVVSGYAPARSRGPGRDA